MLEGKIFEWVDGSDFGTQDRIVDTQVVHHQFSCSSGSLLTRTPTKKVCIYQTVLREASTEIEPGFTPFDNSRNERPEWHEFWVFRQIFQQQLHLDATYTGNVSGKFRQKARITGEEFLTFILKNPGYDVYFVDPYSYNADMYRNVWYQGEIWHPGLMKIAQQVINNAGIRVDLAKLVNTQETSAYCNYWAGNALFWQEYMNFANPVFTYIEEQATAEEREILCQSVYKSRSGVNFKPFIIERLFSTLLALRPDLKALRYPYMLVQKYLALVEDYRSLSAGYARLYAKVQMQ